MLLAGDAELPVTDDQLVELELDDDVEIEDEDGVLEIKGPSFELVVTCLDESGNEGSATAVPEFSGEAEDSDDDDEDSDDDDEDSEDEDDD